MGPPRYARLSFVNSPSEHEPGPEPSGRAPFAMESLASSGQGDDDRVCIVDGERNITFGELDRSANRVANALAAVGLGADDRVGFLGKNCAEAVELLLGAARAGVVATLLNWRLSAAELAYVLGDSTARVVVVTAEFLDVFASLPAMDHIDHVVVVGGHADSRSPAAQPWHEWLAAQPGEPGPIVTADTADTAGDASPDVVLQLYTSGTTGRPKGAMLTRGGLTACIPDTAELWQLDRDSVVLCVLPMFHIAGAGIVAASLWARSCLVIENDVRPETMLATIQRHRATNLILVSVMVQLLVQSPVSAHADLSSLRTVSYGAAPISGQVLRSAVALFGCRMIQPYGLTETTGVLTVLDEHDHKNAFTPGDEVALARLQSCGRARPGVEVRISDIRTGDALPPGEPGEVWARSARLMRGYWNQPAATADAITADGWFRTGDVGVVDADGYLSLLDRLKDTIISGGENIYPAEVEDALHWHPEVADVAVIGIPHDTWGETAHAVVVRTPNSLVDGVTLIAFARERLAHYKCPTSVEFAEALPRNASGKVLRRALREPHWAGRDRRIN